MPATSVTIDSIGLALPKHSIDQESAAAHAVVRCCGDDGERVRRLLALYRRSGVRQRGSTLLSDSRGGAASQSFFSPARGETDRGPSTALRMQRYASDAGPLAIRAAWEALRHAAVRPDQIGHLVTVSCTGFGAPGIDIELIQRLHLPPTCSRTHVGFMGCHAALNGLRVAGGLLAADPTSRALVVAVELCSLHFSYGWDVQQVVANALFADGAAAVVCTAGDPSPGGLRILSHASEVFADTTDAMSWSIGDHGFAMTLSPAVPDLIRANLGSFVDRWLEQLKLTRADIRALAIHPGGPKVLDAVGDALAVDKELLTPSRDVLAEHGNMSSPTVLHIIDRLVRKGAAGPIMALGFGPGLTVEGMLLQK